MGYRSSVLVLISCSLLAARQAFDWTGGAFYSLAAVPLYPCIGALAVRLCDWLRSEAIGDPHFAFEHGIDFQQWTHVQRILIGAAWPLTLPLGVTYYGFIIIVRNIY